MRLIFLGSGEFGLPTLQHLHQHHDILAVVSQPDRPAGRKRKLTPTPIAQWALAEGLPVIRSENVNTDESIAEIKALNADASIVIAFGQKLSPALLDAMGRLTVNLHASLLPKYRGAAPINWAVVDGADPVGVSVIGLAQKMDAGPVYATSSVKADRNETAGELHDRLSQLGPDAIQQVLSDLAADKLNPQEQDESQATHARKLSKVDGTVDFTQSAKSIQQRVHGLTPWPGIRVHWYKHDAAEGDKPQLLFLRRVQATDQASGKPPGVVLRDACVATGEGVLRITEAQIPGGKPQPIELFMNGHPLEPGDRLEEIAASG